MLRLTLLWTLCLFLFPILFIQGIWARKKALILPEASAGLSLELSPELIADDANGTHILGLGDSVIAGVGVDTLDDAITAQFALALSESLSRPVTWTAFGANGDRIKDLITKIPQLRSESTDLIVVSIGVNDVSHLTSVTRWQFEVTNLIALLREKYRAPILFMGLPPMGLFPALPQPLRFTLGVRAALLDLSLKKASELIADVYWLETAADEDKMPMAEDGYHPAAIACRNWAQAAVAHLYKKGLPLLEESKP